MVGASNSLALLADAGHNLGDVPAWCSHGVAAGRQAAPDQRYTYGWKRASIVAAFVNAVLLLVAMGSLAWEAVGRLSAPPPTQGRRDGGGGHRHLRQSRHRAAVHARPPPRPEHPGRLPAHGDRRAVSVGVVVAGGLLLWFGWRWLDPVASLVIALVILVGTWGLFRHRCA